MKKILKTNKPVILCFLFVLFGSLLLNEIQAGRLIDDSNSSVQIKKVSEQENSTEKIEVIENKPVKEEIIINDPKNIPSDQLEAISNYYKEIFTGLSKLEEVDLMPYFHLKDENMKIAQKFDQVYYDLLLTERKQALTDLTIKNYTINLDITDYHIVNQNDVIIWVNENQSITYNGIPDENAQTSSVSNIFRLEYLDNSWKIIRHEKVDALNHTIRDKLEAMDSPDKITGLEKIKENVQAMFIQEGEKLKKEQQKEASKKTPNRDNGTYNRAAAIKYAHTWFNKRNPEFIDYSETGGNCNNYISQCLLAGGLIEDISGNDTWFNGNYEPSLSWILVDHFYDYVQNNKDAGFSSITNDNFYSGMVGDIIQLGNDNNWKHSVIITGLIKDKDGNTIDYLIDSNTNDNKTIPVSTYGYPQMRLIKIVGKN